MPTVLITGANRGIGLEFTKQYAQEGWRVLACCRAPQSSSSLQALAASFAERIEIHALDVAQFEQISQLSAKLKSESIDLLLNNAGVYPESDAAGFGGVDYAEWMRAFQINTMAPLRMAEAFTAQIARSHGKTIATLSSKMGSLTDNTSGGSYLYRSSKTAINMVMKSLAIDLAPRGIMTVTLHPGWVKTDMGGPHALISTQQSVTGLRTVIANLTPENSGKFYDYSGEEIPW